MKKLILIDGKPECVELTEKEAIEFNLEKKNAPIPEPTELEQLRADMDFLLMLMEG